VQIRFAVLAIVILAAYGCATEPQPQQPAAGAAPASAAVPAPYQSKGPVYRTGSRLPPMDDDGGAAPVSSQSKDDYINDRNSSMSPTH
jgi:hypothetical protein